MCPTRVRWTSFTGFDAETTFAVFFLFQKLWLVNQWSKSMRLHLASPGPPSRPTCALSRQPLSAFPVQGLNLITARYFLFFLHNVAVNCPMLPSQAQRTWAGCLSLRVKRAHCLPFHWGSAFWKRLCLCVRNGLCLFGGRMLDTSTVG